MEQKEPAKHAEKLIESAEKLGQGAQKTFVSMVLALLLLWQGSIEPLVPKLNALWTSTNKSIKAIYKAEEYQNEKGKKSTEEEISTKLKRLKDVSTETKEKRRTDAANAAIAFSIPGLPGINVPTRYAGLVWSVLLTLAILYITHCRKNIVKLYAASARHLKTTDTTNFPYRPATPFNAPWWLQPLPRRNGESISATEFSRFLQGDISTSSAMVGVGSIFLLLIALQIRVALISTGSLAIFSNQGKLDAHSISCIILNALPLVSSDYLIASWFSSTTVPDNSFSQRDAKANQRRVALTTFAIVVGSFALAKALANAKTSTLISWMRSPRYKRQHKSEAAVLDIAQGLYINKNSRKIQLVEASCQPNPRFKKNGAPINCLSGIRTSAKHQPKKENYEAISISNIDTSLINSIATNRRGPLIESIATELWKKQRFAEACQMLFWGVTADLNEISSRRKEKPNIRLYSLLTKYSFQSSNVRFFESMLADIEERNLRHLFHKNLVNWKNPTSRWRKRLKYNGWI